MKILIAEKEKRNRLGIIRKLPEGTDISEFTSWESLERCLNGSNGYCAIVVGKRLEDLSGFEVIRRMKDKCPLIKIFFYGNSELIDGAKEAGADRVYEKETYGGKKEFREDLARLLDKECSV